MITKDLVTQHVNEALAGTDFFIVELELDDQNNIQVALDSDTSITIDDCVNVTRFVEEQLNEGGGNFSLQVSTAGATNPLKMPRQYKKNIGRQVTVQTNDDEKYKGTLSAADIETFTITFTKKVKQDNKKKKKKVTEQRTFAYHDVKSTKVVISFK